MITTDQERLRDLSAQVLEHAETLAAKVDWAAPDKEGSREVAARAFGFYRLGFLARVVGDPKPDHVRFLSLGTGLTEGQVTHTLQMLAACAAIGLPADA